jgi:hypothetical protein
MLMTGGRRTGRAAAKRGARRVGVQTRPLHVTSCAVNQVVVMKIHFPEERPEYCARDLIVAFAAEVDGARVQCAITAEALEDHFGAASLREDDLIAAFNSNRHPIEHAARRLLHEIGAKPVLMHSGYFRFCE